MRYRPFGPSGSAISNLTLSFGLDALSSGREAGLELVYAALEAGINAYRLETTDPVIAEVLGEALSHVDRNLVHVIVTLGADNEANGGRVFSADGMTQAIDRVLHHSDLGWIDLAVLNDPAEHELPQSSLKALKALHANGRIKLLGVLGGDQVMDLYVATGAFDALMTPLGINVDWRVKNRIRTAREQDMTIFAYDYFKDRRTRSPDEPVYKKGLFGIGGQKRPPDTPQKDAFGFLYRTQGWTAESICLAYALSDPSVASVIIRPRDADQLRLLAETPERDMPPGLAAQIEMARVTASKA